VNRVMEPRSPTFIHLRIVTQADQQVPYDGQRNRDSQAMAIHSVNCSCSSSD
jgi:hypothetical protein